MKTKILLAALAAAVLATSSLAQTPATTAPVTPALPTDAVALYQISIARLEQKNAKEAVEFAEKAVQADPARPEYYSQLGIALSQRMGELNFMQQAMTAGKMKKAFEKSVALDPRHVPGLIGLSRYYSSAPEIAGGSSEKAQEFARRVQQLVPFLGEIELGNIANQDEKWADALTHYETASKLKPDHAYLHFLCGRMLVRLERKDEARSRFEAALKLDPKLDAAAKALATLDAPVAGQS